MIDAIDFDPALAGPWPSGAVRLAPYGTGADPELDAAVKDVWLEVKAASEPAPAEQLQKLLNEMTDELRAQFEAFRKIRADAETKLAAGGDEAEQKLAKADIKSASDALSLIVRTIEKIDSLQRSLAHDRETAIEQEFDEAAYKQCWRRPSAPSNAGLPNVLLPPVWLEAARPFAAIPGLPNLNDFYRFVRLSLAPRVVAATGDKAGLALAQYNETLAGLSSSLSTLKQTTVTLQSATEPPQTNSSPEEKVGDEKSTVRREAQGVQPRPFRQLCLAQSRLNQSWKFRSRTEQQAPKGDWHTWLVMGGRGSGKTRAGAEWVHETVLNAPQPLRFALVAETLADAREVMIDGISGICRIARFKRPDFEISRRRLVWPNGSIAQIFSSEDPDSLRGPQFDYAWCDELAKWKHGQETWDMLQFGLRLGREPRQLVTTTPRPMPLIRTLIADPGTVMTRLSTRANAENLAPGFLSAIEKRYGGTRLGRQELDGELIEDREDALWNRAMLERSRIRTPGPIGRIVVAVDPPAAEKAAGSCCGIVVAGLEATGRAVVLADLSVANASPAEWGNAVVRAFRRFQADRVIAEVNQGGDMVAAILRSVDAALPVTMVRATRGKFLRAEPVAALYEQGRVAHAGTFPALEDQMCDFGPDGLSGGGSPDRLDALVWALTGLVLGGAGEPRVRGV